MTRPEPKKVRDELKRDREQLKEALSDTINEDMATAWLPNTIAWIVVVGGAFLLNLLLLLAISGG